MIVISLGIPIDPGVRAAIRAPARCSSAAARPTARLERIEQAVEAVAIEVERIAEAQRFSAKLMAEHSALCRASDTAS